MNLPSCIEWAHIITAKAIKQGPPLTIDATCGNGFDTIHLLKNCSPAGSVWAIDIQERSFMTSAENLKDIDFSAKLINCLGCHSRISSFIPSEYHGEISAAMFNLGYLPGSDRKVITKKDTTIKAITGSMEIIRTGGIITVMCYKGHDESEYEAVLEWAKNIDQKKFQILHYNFPNQKNKAPSLFCIEKR